MKTSNDPRHLQRVRVMQEVFSWDFAKEQELEDPKALKVINNLEKIDQLITEAAPTWPISKINRIDLAILRQAVYELLVEASQPTKVIIDEAVEIAKEYGSDSSPSFINGALGKLVEDYKL